MKDEYKLISFQDHGDARGNLIVAEGNGQDIPFEIKRIFYIYGSDETVVRGKHANINSEFVMINVSGSCKIRIDNGKEIETVELSSPNTGLYLKKMVWKEMYDFSRDSVLLVLASEHYYEKEYIRDYSDYLKIVKM